MKHSYQEKQIRSSKLAAQGQIGK